MNLLSPLNPQLFPGLLQFALIVLVFKGVLFSCRIFIHGIRYYGHFIQTEHLENCIEYFLSRIQLCIQCFLYNIMCVYSVYCTEYYCMYFLSTLPLYILCFLSRIVFGRLTQFSCPEYYSMYICFCPEHHFITSLSYLFSVEKLVEIGKKILSEKCADLSDVRYDMSV